MALSRTHEPQDFKTFRCWHEARALTKEIYQITAGFPAVEQFGLTSQLRRAALSIIGNIAEGARKLTVRDFSRFLNIAEGSTAEIGAYLLVAGDLDYLTEAQVADYTLRFERLLSMIYHLRLKVEGRSIPGAGRSPA